MFKTWDSLSPRVDLKSSSLPERCFEIYAHLTHSRRRVCGYFDGVMALAVSSDGQSLAFAGNLIQLARSGPPVSRFGNHIWAASTGRWTTPVRIDEVAYRAPDLPVRRLVWNNAGTALAAEMGTSITIHDVATGTAREIVRGVLGGWSPDDRWMLFCTNEGDLGFVNLDSGLVKMDPWIKALTVPQWMAGTNLLSVATADRWVFRWPRLRIFVFDEGRLVDSRTVTWLDLWLSPYQCLRLR